MMEYRKYELAEMPFLMLMVLVAWPLALIQSSRQRYRESVEQGLTVPGVVTDPAVWLFRLYVFLVAGIWWCVVAALVLIGLFSSIKMLLFIA